MMWCPQQRSLPGRASYRRRQSSSYCQERGTTFTAASTSCVTPCSSSCDATHRCHRLPDSKKPGREVLPAGPLSAVAEKPTRYELTMALRLFRGMTRTFLLAGFALNIIFSPVKGLTPSRALVAAFLTTFIFSRPGIVNRPLPRRLFLITPDSESKTRPTCLRESPVSLQMCARTSDFVGAPPFFAILRYSSG